MPINIRLITCKHCGKAYNNPIKHVCKITPARARANAKKAAQANTRKAEANAKKAAAKKK